MSAKRFRHAVQVYSNVFHYKASSTLWLWISMSLTGKLPYQYNEQFFESVCVFDSHTISAAVVAAFLVKGKVKAKYICTCTFVSQEQMMAVVSHRITDHRMFGVGRDLCGSSSPTPLPKQGHLQQAAPDLLQAGLEYLQRRRIHNLPGQPVPVLRHPQSDEVLPHVQTELAVLQFLPIASCPVAGHH